MSDVHEISHTELETLIERVEHAITHELALSVEDMKLLLLAINTLSLVQQKLEDRDLTLHKLRKLLGMIQQSERNKSSSSNKNSSSQKDRRSNRTKKKNSPPPVEHHKLIDITKGSLCEACKHGRLYKFEPANLLRVTGHAPYEAVRHISERLRCNACQHIVTAPLPQEVLDDGEPNQQYGYSARALMAIHKFYSGVPYYHQGNLSEMLGVTISASTIYDQCEALANSVMPMYYYIIKLAANAILYLLDDTRNLILEQEAETRPNRNGKGERLRTGIYTSGLIAYTKESNEIVLFNTSLGHAGEFIDEVLAKRNKELPLPVLVSDALSHNTPTLMEVHQAYCNAHCRREFYDLSANHPETIDWVLETYSKIWENEAKTKEQKLNPKARLAYHQKNSLPVMKELKDWALEYQQSSQYEEHSGLGKAIKYLLKHYEKLTLFCKIPGVPIDNNRMEETLKLVIRNRKTSHFFKTVNGAGVANVITSIIATANRAGVNIFDYLKALQRNHDAVRENPAAWTPWAFAKAQVETEKFSKAA